MHQILRVMNKWLEGNAWAIGVGGIALVGSYVLYGYRITALEAQAATTQTSISTLNTQQQQIQVSLAQIQTDIEYIKQNVNTLTLNSKK